MHFLDVPLSKVPLRLQVLKSEFHAYWEYLVELNIQLGLL